MRLQEEYNRVNTITPYGGITYTKDGPQPMSFDDWQAQNPSSGTQPSGYSRQGWVNNGGSSKNANPRAGYDKYAAGFGGGKTTANFNYSPELQSLFDRQFDPNAYDQYKTDYMGDYNELLQPGRDRQMDRFEQRAFDRGMPEGGDIYGDLYRTTLGDPWARQDTMAAQNAQQMADQARLQDYNRLMSAMGGSQINAPNIDVMGAQNMALNADFANQANQSSIWDTLPTLAGAYMVGAPDSSWLWS